MAELTKNYDIDLEMALIGVAMTSNRALASLHMIKPFHFFSVEIQGYWQGILHLWTRGKEANIITVKAYCKANELEYDLDKLMDISSPLHYDLIADRDKLEYAAERMIDLWQKREVQKLGSQMADGLDLNDAIQFLTEISGSVNRDGTEDIAEISLRVADQIEQSIFAYRNNAPIPNAVYFGIPEIDKMGGFRGGDFVILAGRPAMGKSTLSRISMRFVANSFPVQVLTKEMTKENIISLLASSEVEIDSRIVREGRLSDKQHNDFLYGLGIVGNLPIQVGYISDLATLIGSIRKFRMATDMNIPAVVYIDYLQQVTNKIKGSNRAQEVAMVSNTLKELALQLNICIIALAQLSREVEKRGGDKRPFLSDLKESGDIEQDADTILFAYRPEYYNFETWADGSPVRPNEAMIDIAKNRHGPTGAVRFGLDLPTSRYFSYENNYNIPF